MCVSVISLDPDNRVVDMRELHKYIVFTLGQYLDETNELKRYHVLKAVLKFLKKHASLLRHSIIPEVMSLLQQMFLVARHKSRDVRKLAWGALEGFVGAVAEELVEETGGAAGKEICEKFMSQFIAILNEGWVSEEEEGDSRGGDTGYTMVLRAVGQFAKPISLHLGEAVLRQQVMQQLIDKGSILFSDTSHSGAGSQSTLNIDEQLRPEVDVHLSYIMTSLARVISELTAVDGEIIQHVESVIQKLLLRFPQLTEKQKDANCGALWQLLAALDVKCTEIDSIVVTYVVQEGILLAMSRTYLIGESEMTMQGDYASFFRQLLPRDDQRGQGSQRRLRQRIYDSIMKCIIEYISKLDLVIVNDEPIDLDDESDGQQAADDTQHIEDRPRNMKDYGMFLCLVDFCLGLLSNSDFPELFLPWAYTFSQVVTDLNTALRVDNSKSARCQDVSGFHKLMGLCFDICSRAVAVAVSTSYVEGTHDLSSNGADGTDGDTAPAAATASGASTLATALPAYDSCMELFSDYVADVAVRLCQFSDELLCTCIETVLSLPLDFVPRCIGDLVEPLKRGLDIGVSHMPMAVRAITTLETWLGIFPAAVGECLPKLLPSLDKYLYVSGEQGMLLSEEQEVQEEARQIQQKFFKKDRIQLDTTTSSVEIQRRVLELLGKLGGENQALLHRGESDSAAGDNGIVWGQKDVLQFEIPLQGRNSPSIFLDRLLPRVVELAEKSSDRKTKISACELLHAMVLHAVGLSKNDHKLDSLYSHLFPTLLRLSVDGESVTKQLFEPLLQQLIHWFTRAKGSLVDAMVLLDAITEGICDRDNGALKDASAKAFAEFFKWSIRQQKGRGRAADSDEPLHSDNLVKRLYNLVNHPDPHKRNGSALAFRQLYRDFAKNDELMKKHTLQLLRHYLESLKISHQDPPALQSAERARAAIERLRKIVEKAHQAGKHFWQNEVGDNSLSGLVKELFKNCSAPQTGAMLHI